MQSASSRSATSRLLAAAPSSAELDRASRVGDKIKRRFATNVNAFATSVPHATSTTTTAGASLQATPNEHPTPGEGSSTRSPLSVPSTSVANLSSLLVEGVHDLPPASTSISTDPPSDDNDGFTLVTKGKKSRSHKMTEALGSATHPKLTCFVCSSTLITCVS